MKFSKTNYSKKERFKMFFKNFGYLVALGVAAVAITTVGLVAGLSGINTKADVGVDPPSSGVEAPAAVWHSPVDKIDVQKFYDGKKLQYNETLNNWKIHKAVDFKLNDGDNVYACFDGTVEKIYTNLLEGTVVVISHDGGIKTTYKSLNEKSICVNVGDKVSGGAKIGTAGSTMGNEANQGAHLHLEITLNNVLVDPANYINLGNK